MPETETVPEDYRLLLLQFIGSLTLADDVGDMADDIQAVLQRLDLEIEYEDLHELGSKLGAMGITTLYGTPLREVDGDDNEENG